MPRANRFGAGTENGLADPGASANPLAMRASFLSRWFPWLAVVAGVFGRTQAATNSLPLLPEAPARKKAPAQYTAAPYSPPPTTNSAARTFNPDALAWKEKALKLQAKDGQTSVDFKLVFTNVSSKAVVISGTQTSCGCTVAKLPQTPWTIGPGETGEIGGTMNILGKSGLVTKTVGVDYDGGRATLSVTVDIPKADPTRMREADRQRNLAVASADRQAVFRGDCATCHVTPTIGKRGHELYNTACGICHDAPNKASMVPALRELKVPTDYDYWLNWIRNGKPNSLMPAFDLKQGGILDQAQMESLAEYLDSAEFGKRSIRGALPLGNPTK